VSNAVYTAHPIFVETVPGRSKSSLPRPPLHVHAQAIVPTYFMSIIYIGLCRPKALTLTQLWSYKMFQVLLIVRINNSVGLRGIVNYHLLHDTSQYGLAR
jgi:hypothetical protein